MGNPLADQQRLTHHRVMARRHAGVADRPSLVLLYPGSRRGLARRRRGREAARFVRDDDRRLFQVAHLALPA
ncbi:MAG: hypothetical protein R2742_04950 [Micropruina glycogenica]